MNAVAIAFGSLAGRDGARQARHDFWKALSMLRDRGRASTDICCGFDCTRHRDEQLRKPRSVLRPVAGLWRHTASVRRRLR